MNTAQVIAEHERSGRYFTVGDRVESFVLDVGIGEPVVCLHGVPASSFLYRKVVRELAARGLRGVAFDLPGLGLAARPSTSTTPGPASAGLRWQQSMSWVSTGSTWWCTTSGGRWGSRWPPLLPVASDRSRC